MTAKYPFAVDAREFSGKRVLITGGTKGLGAAMVHRFVLSGARVASTARSPANRDPPPRCSFRPICPRPPALSPLPIVSSVNGAASTCWWTMSVRAMSLPRRSNP